MSEQLKRGATSQPGETRIQKLGPSEGPRLWGIMTSIVDEL